VHLDGVTFIFFGALIVAVILHEISHGVVALWFGDDTAKRAGRLTLNPIPHIDPFGSIILPAMGALTGIPVIGWAKPVPVNPAGLRKPREHMVLVSLAGPATNFLLAAVGAGVAHLFFTRMDLGLQTALAHLPNSWSVLDVLHSLPTGFVIAYSFAFVNVFLGLFNLIPIPPLDGSAIFEMFMPDAWRPRWYQFRPYGLLVLFALVFWTGILDTLIQPFLRVLDAVVLS
jgi:Zn-dependent protease